jgi:hypothetical protein
VLLIIPIQTVIVTITYMMVKDAVSLAALELSCRKITDTDLT